MNRTGFYTNAEYLELRFTRSLRIASAILQTFYRFVAMAMVVYAMATMFNVIIGIDQWHAVWVAMALTLLYVFTSGQLGVVMAAIQRTIETLHDEGVVRLSSHIKIGTRTDKVPSMAGKLFK